MNDSGNNPSTNNRRILHPTDTVLVLFLLVLCACLYYLTTQFDSVSDMFSQDITPEFFPQLLLLVIAVMIALLPIEERLFGNGRQIDKGRSDRVGSMTYLTVLLLISILLLLPWLGAYLAMVVVCLLLPFLWRERRLMRIIAFVVISPLAVTLLFTQVLKVYFEPGIFGLGFR